MWNHDHNIIMSIVSHAIISLIVCLCEKHIILQVLEQVLTNIIHLYVLCKVKKPFNVGMACTERQMNYIYSWQVTNVWQCQNKILSKKTENELMWATGVKFLWIFKWKNDKSVH